MQFTLVSLFSLTSTIYALPQVFPSIGTQPQLQPQQAGVNPFLAPGIIGGLAGAGNGLGGLGQQGIFGGLGQQQQQQQQPNLGIQGNIGGLGGAIGVSQPPLSNTGTPGAELAGLLSPGRTQVFANQKFGVSQRMMVQVSEGQIVCEVGNSQTMLRMGQMYKFRGGQREVCLAQQPSIVLSEAY